LVFGCAGRVGIFDWTFPAIIEANVKPNLEKTSRMAGEGMESNENCERFKRLYY
jgi:hypothetical protein